MKSRKEELKEISNTVFSGGFIEQEINQAFSKVKQDSGLSLSPFLLFESLGIDFMKGKSQDNSWVLAEQKVIKEWQSMLRLVAGSVQTNSNPDSSQLSEIIENLKTTIDSLK